jgi:hypothetical protein
MWTWIGEALNNKQSANPDQLKKEKEKTIIINATARSDNICSRHIGILDS